MVGIQLLSVVVGLAAIHLTYLYYKRANFNKKELYFWGFIWLAFIFTAIFPNALKPLVNFLGFSRPMDFLMVLAFTFLFSMSFRNYIATRKMKGLLEKLVRDLALKDLE